LVCVVDAPLCAKCPLKKNCFAFLHHKQSVFPVSSRNPVRPAKSFAAIRVQNSDGVWLISHKSRLLNGLYSFPLVECDPVADSKEKIEKKFAVEFGVNVRIRKKLGIVRHEYTHFRQVCMLFEAQVTGYSIAPFFFSSQKIKSLPLTKLQHKLLSLG